MDLFAAAKLPSTPPPMGVLVGWALAGLATGGAWLGGAVAMAWGVKEGALPGWSLLALSALTLAVAGLAGLVMRDTAVIEERLHVGVVQLRFPPAELTSEQKARFWVIEDSRHPKPDKVDLSGRSFFMTAVLAAGVTVGALFGPPAWFVAGIQGALGALACLQIGVARLARARALPMLGAVSRAQMKALGGAGGEDP